MAVRHSYELSGQPFIADEQMSRALVAHAKGLASVMAQNRDLPRDQLRFILMRWRPYCDEAPDLFPPLCIVRKIQK